LTFTGYFLKKIGGANRCQPLKSQFVIQVAKGKGLESQNLARPHQEAPGWKGGREKWAGMWARAFLVVSLKKILIV
jgi:hypothetical protein